MWFNIYQGDVVTAHSTFDEACGSPKGMTFKVRIGAGAHETHFRKKLSAAPLSEAEYTGACADREDYKRLAIESDDERVQMYWWQQYSKFWWERTKDGRMYHNLGCTRRSLTNA